MGLSVGNDYLHYSEILIASSIPKIVFSNQGDLEVHQACQQRHYCGELVFSKNVSDNPKNINIGGLV